MDPFHLETYGTAAINYNRDVDAFPLLKRILEKITGDRSPYQSPTDMGVNRAGFCIIDDDAVRNAALQEIVRRYFRYSCEYVMGISDSETVQKVELLMKNYDLKPESRPVVSPARQRLESHHSADNVETAAASIMLPDGSIVTGMSSSLMHAPAAAILNAVKKMAGIDKKTHLLSPDTIDSIRSLKRAIKTTPLQLDLEEVLVALSVSAASCRPALRGMEQLPKLRNCEAHLTHIPQSGDQNGLRTLGINVTSDPLFPSRKLYLS